MSVAAAYKSLCTTQQKEPIDWVAAELENVASGQCDLSGNAGNRFGRRIDDDELTTICEAFDKGFAEAEKLAYLDLSYNSITDDGTVRLSETLQKFTKLRTIILSWNGVESRGVDELLTALDSCVELELLCLSGNLLGAEGVKSVANFLKRNSSLDHLGLSDCYMDNIQFSTVMNVVARNNTLRSLDVSNPHVWTIEGEHIISASKMLAANTTLESINLSKCDIRDNEINELVNGLSSNSTLKKLYLKGNKIGSDGAAKLAELLLLQSEGKCNDAFSCRLEELDLDNNAIGERDATEGAEALANAIKSNPHLWKLRLNHNQLCDAALDLLAQGAQNSAGVQKLSLFHNNFGQESMGSLQGLASRRPEISTDCNVYVVDDVLHVSEAGA